jgi:hypothetical protein
MNTKHFLTSLMAASALALGAGGAHAATFTVDLTGDASTASHFDTISPGSEDVGDTLSLTGLDDTNAFTVYQGDTINGTIKLTNGTLTLHQAGSFSAADLFLTGGADQDTQASTTVTFLLAGVAVDTGSDLAGTRTDLALGASYGANHPDITFDEIEFSSTVTILGTPDATPPIPGVPTTVNGAFLNLQAITNTPIAAVPEPASWALMLVGFGGLGVMLRRRRNLVAA